MLDQISTYYSFVTLLNTFVFGLNTSCFRVQADTFKEERPA